MHDTDKNIIDRLRKGDQSALKYLFDVYYRELVIYAMKIVVNRGVAEETVQDLFIRLWKNRSRLNLQKSLQAYLITAVRNRCVNFIKSRYGRTRFEDLDGIDQYSNAEAADMNVTVRELREAIHNAVRLLPPKCKIIFNLSRNAGMTVDEIAAQLGISGKTVRSQISIAIRKIKAHLEDQWGELL
jgi:RNA polymerase sigma-70 factor (ECF subfamily)